VTPLQSSLTYLFGEKWVIGEKTVKFLFKLFYIPPMKKADFVPKAQISSEDIAFIKGEHLKTLSSISFGVLLLLTHIEKGPTLRPPMG